MATEYVRIWNERSKAIGGVGGDAVIATLKAAGFDARPCEAEFKNHEGIEVPRKDMFSADALVIKVYGRPGQVIDVPKGVDGGDRNQRENVEENLTVNAHLSRE